MMKIVIACLAVAIAACAASPSWSAAAPAAFEGPYLAGPSAISTVLPAAAPATTTYYSGAWAPAAAPVAAAAPATIISSGPAVWGSGYKY